MMWKSHCRTLFSSWHIAEHCSHHGPLQNTVVITSHCKTWHMTFLLGIMTSMIVLPWTMSSWRFFQESYPLWLFFHEPCPYDCSSKQLWCLKWPEYFCFQEMALFMNQVSLMFDGIKSSLLLFGWFGCQGNGKLALSFKLGLKVSITAARLSGA